MLHQFHINMIQTLFQLEHWWWWWRCIQNGDDHSVRSQIESHFPLAWLGFSLLKSQQSNSPQHPFTWLCFRTLHEGTVLISTLPVVLLCMFNTHLMHVYAHETSIIKFNTVEKKSALKIREENLMCNSYY